MHRAAPIPSSATPSQRGAITVLAALSIVILLGFAGLAVDLGRAIVMRNELQAAADACALSAALELNGSAAATGRAASAGAYFAGRNRQNFQAEPARITSAGIGFSSVPTGPFVADGAIASSDARYVRCTGEIASVAAFLMGAAGIANFDVKAAATAGNLPAQVTCSVPMALSARGGGENFGYALGASAALGELVWAYVADGATATGLDSLRAALIGPGACNASTQIGRLIPVQPGDAVTIMDEWNSRFGVYRQNASLSPNTATPDLSGHGYREPITAGGAYSDYLASKVPERTAFSGTIPAFVADPDVNRLYGASYRRLVVMPVLNCGGGPCGSGSHPVAGWACVLMLSPVAAQETPRIEFVSNAASVQTPCRSPGTPGGPGSPGPRVPTLIS